MGDTRDNDPTTTGVSTYLSAIATKAASFNPKAVLVNGDLINGDTVLLQTPPGPDFATQFANWKTAMAPIYNAGIPIYTVRGNHENEVTDFLPTNQDLKTAYYNAFGAAVPQNGPNDANSNGNQTGFTWNLSSQNNLNQKWARVIGLDQYFYYNPTAQGTSHYYEIAQAWLDKQLTKTAPTRYTFVMSHEPAYYVSAGSGGTNPEGDFYGTTNSDGSSNQAGITARSAFWNSLGANGVKMYLVCHVHNLQVGYANDSNGNRIYQNVAGNGGANPLVTTVGTWDPGLTMAYQNTTDYGFALYTVASDKITIDFYTCPNPNAAVPVWSIGYSMTLGANPVYTWTGLGVGTNWSTAGNWDVNAVDTPSAAGDTAVFNSGAGTIASTVGFGASVTNNRLFVASGQVTFNLAGNTYTATTTNIDGSESATYLPSLRISGAGSTFNTTTLKMDGTSSLTVDNNASATCTTITIEGGTPTITENGNINFTTLDLGNNNLTVTGQYAQPATSALKLTANSSTDFGKITSNTAAVVNAGSAVNVTVGGYIPNNATLRIIDTGGLGIGSAPGTITSSNQYVTFSGASSGGNLVLTADRSVNGFSSVATNSNAAAVGAVLDNVTNPSADMTTVLDTLSAASSSQVASSLNTMYPTADRGVIETTNTSLAKFTGATLLRLEDSKLEENKDESAPVEDVHFNNDIWAQTYGAYANQDSRGASNGYLARVWGAVFGIDRAFLDNRLRLGFAQGFSGSQILSADSSGRTGITSYQSCLYTEYEGKERPFSLDAIFGYGYNDFDTSRRVTAVDINRSASADYHGEQFSSYLEGGYKFKTRACDVTPLLAIDYTHLHLAGYTERGADSLDLRVDAQNYDTLQVGTGFRVSRAFDTKDILFTPELHFRYFYAVTNDDQQTLAGFTGGGTAFQTNGYRPAPSSFNLGARLEFFNKKNITVLTDCDTSFKDGYYDVGGSITVKYSF